MCTLCDKIYRCTETLPELMDCIGRDPEGVVQLKVLNYKALTDQFFHMSFSINFCPECGRNLEGE